MILDLDWVLKSFIFIATSFLVELLLTAHTTRQEWRHLPHEKQNSLDILQELVFKNTYSV